MQVCSTGVNACAVHTFSWESVTCAYAVISSCQTALLSIHYNTTQICMDASIAKVFMSTTIWFVVVNH